MAQATSLDTDSMSRHTNWARIGLSAITGTSLAAVATLSYFRFENEEEMAASETRMSRPEMWTEEHRQWGTYGTGAANVIYKLVPNAIKESLFNEDNIRDQVQKHRERRRQEIQDIIINSKN